MECKKTVQQMWKTTGTLLQTEMVTAHGGTCLNCIGARANSSSERDTSTLYFEVERYRIDDQKMKSEKDGCVNCELWAVRVGFRLHYFHCLSPLWSFDSITINIYIIIVIGCFGRLSYRNLHIYRYR